MHLKILSNLVRLVKDSKVIHLEIHSKQIHSHHNKRVIFYIIINIEVDLLDMDDPEPEVTKPPITSVSEPVNSNVFDAFSGQ